LGVLTLERRGVEQISCEINVTVRAEVFARHAIGRVQRDEAAVNWRDEDPACARIS
jgi:hypothetical protein